MRGLFPRASKLTAIAAVLLLAACTSGTAPSTPPTTAPPPASVGPAPTVSATPEPAASVEPTSLSTTALGSAALAGGGGDDARVRPGQPWIVFQSLADEFDPDADDDGIVHDDTIFLVRPNGTGLHRLPPTSLVGSEIRPTWSADGRRIAFIRAHLPDDDSELWTIDADGTNARLLYGCSDECNSIGDPDWSRDGRSIYFGRDSDVPVDGPPTTFEIWRYDLRSGTAGPALTRKDGMTVEQARISPDGKQAVYVRFRDILTDTPTAALFVADLRKPSIERRITDWNLFVADPDWSVRGVIAFNSYDLRGFPVTTEPVNLYTVRPSGRDLRQITSYGPDDTRAAQPRWTANGQAIVFTQVARSDTDPYGVRHIALIGADGHHQRILADGIIGTHPELRP